MGADAQRGQQRKLNLLELELQAVLRLLVCILDSKQGLSESAAIAHNC